MGNIEISFLLHPSLKASKQGNEIIVLREQTPMLRIMHLSPLASFVHSPDTPGCGWYSPSFGEKQATTRIAFSGRLTPGTKVVTDFTFMWNV